MQIFEAFIEREPEYSYLPESQKLIVQEIKDWLFNNDHIPLRINVTADDSVLFQFRSPDENKYLIDVYTDTVVVLREQGEMTYIWEFEKWNEKEPDIKGLAEALEQKLLSTPNGKFCHECRREIIPDEKEGWVHLDGSRYIHIPTPRVDSWI